MYELLVSSLFESTKAHKSSSSLIYLEHNRSTKHIFKRRGQCRGWVGGAVKLKLQAVMTSQYQKLNTCFHRTVCFLFTILLLSNYNNGCLSFLEASSVKGARNLRKMGKLLALGIFFLG